ncbi:hypothetical protein [Apilactobacillus timberlakei]|uniref:hypothetical protein n=1 Tax=Apilactobacillus timberlakei TaxID=2008380 RepID=UPI0015E873AF|nr:hypothetical protein [Apilactobacillus timberlakei]
MSNRINVEDIVNKKYYHLQTTDAHKDKLFSIVKNLRNKLSVQNTEETNKGYIRDSLKN